MTARGAGRAQVRSPKGALLPTLALLAAVIAGCGVGPAATGESTGSPGTSPAGGASAPAAGSPTPGPAGSPGSGSDVAVLVGAGDIGACDKSARVAETAHLVETAAPPTAIVFTAGDNAYPSGTPDEFRRCYDPTWGAFRDRTRPAAGNHDWKTPGAAGYLGYFGAAAGTPATATSPATTWYAYDAGTWRVIVLDSDCEAVGGCGPDSPEGRWLAAELATHPACSLAIWHHPRFSSGKHGSNPAMAPLFDAVSAAGVDLVLNGHDHSYERFGRLGLDGSLDPAGIREIVVGTGGGESYVFGKPLVGSEVRVTDVPAVLVLELRPGEYSWRLVGGPDATTLDQGADTCRS